MENNTPSFPQDERGNKFPLTEAVEILIEAEIQALKDAEKASDLLIQVLQQQIVEVENLGIEMKRGRDVPRSLKKAYNNQYWWKGLCAEIYSYKEEQKDAWRFLEREQEQCRKNIAALKQLQEDVGNLYPK